MLGVKQKDISGRRYSSLYVLEYNGSGSEWLCRCDCGDSVVVRSEDLESGLINNCGCQWQDKFGGK
jgi:hypothetical protein